MPTPGGCDVDVYSMEPRISVVDRM
jgi:hypothetical protein